ncbi:uncharacterized protein LOC106065096 [Biomphalaria glabrata]|uniref:Uncharacterized protein LOC106065096 n=1 Tax=Biomphalaria glabrata TaxID=6526 RepID=A0A9W3BJQ3_BIOGL|nr:uncharacterized protein LOC106065096 [Biomphalaria glabrata]
MKMLFAVVLLGFVALFDPVYGATCKSNTTSCVATKYTQAACNASKICACEVGYFPIRTGCGMKYSKPSVILPDGNSFEVLEGKSAVLTCSTVAPVVDWYYDNGTFITTGTTYTLASASAANVGKIKCKGKLEKTDSALDSDFSDALDIKLIKKTGEVTEKPIFIATPSSLFSGKNATLRCTNIPMGYDTTKIKFKLSNGTEITSPLVMTSDLKDIKALCNLSDTSAHAVTNASELGSLPTQTTTISSVLVTSTAVDKSIYSVDEAIILTCVTTPGPNFVDISTKSITYQWLSNATVVQNSSSATYNLPKAAGNYIISCNATYGEAHTASSNSINITRSSTYLTKPTILANPTNPVLGSLLTLACVSNYTDVTYSWKMGTEYIAQQFDHTIQLDSLTASDAGAYVCIVKRSAVTMTSEVFTISNGHVLTICSALVYGLLFMISRHLV